MRQRPVDKQLCVAAREDIVCSSGATVARSDGCVVVVAELMAEALMAAIMMPTMRTPSSREHRDAAPLQAQRAPRGQSAP